MIQHTLLDDPQWWRVLTDPANPYWIDPLVAVEGEGRGTTAEVELHFGSGATRHAELSRPTANTLRVRVGAPALPLSALDEPLLVRQTGPAVTVLDLDSDPLAVLGPAGLSTPVLRPPGQERFGVSDAEALPIVDTSAPTGLLMKDSAQVGWVHSIALGPWDEVFGSGESFPSLDLRGRRRTLINRETHTVAGRDLAYLNVPLFWSSGGWGVLYNTGGMVGADVGASQRETATVLVDGVDLDLTAISGDPAAVLRTAWALTGEPGEVPDWAFGVWLSRATFTSEAEIQGILDELERAGASPDVVHVDAWLAGNVFRTFTCEWRPARDRFPAGWTDRLRERGVRSSIWLNPFVLAGSDVGEELRGNGLLLLTEEGAPATTADRDNRWIIDFTNPGARLWWRGRIAELFGSERPDAVKLDFGEEIPARALAHDGRTGAQLRNAYARLYQEATMDAINQLRGSGALSGPVPMFCRSGTHGSQRNPCHWVGDTPATWDGLQSALYAMQSLALSGFGLTTHDAGGFISPGTGDIPTRRLDGEDIDFFADVEPELYARWVQWAAVSPLMRLHGLGLREPTAYPEPHRSAAIAAFRLRRKLVGYLAESYRAGTPAGYPLARPMPLAFPADPALSAVHEQYLLGPDVLVAPLLRAGGVGRVALPAGEWRNLFDGAPERGPGWLFRTYPVDSFPAYVRSGSALADALANSGWWPARPA